MPHSKLALARQQQTGQTLSFPKCYMKSCNFFDSLFIFQRRTKTGEEIRGNWRDLILRNKPWDDQGEKAEPELPIDVAANSGPVLNSFIYIFSPQKQEKKLQEETTENQTGS